MASYERRGDAWRAHVVRQGQRKTASFDTRAEAEAWAIRTEARIMAGGDELPPRAAAPARQAAALLPAVTVAELMARYAREVSPTKAGKRWEVTRLRTWPANFPLFAGPVAELTPAALATWRDARLRSVKGSTVNRELNLVSAVCNKALREWRIPELAINPVRAIQRPTNPRPRTRMISAAETTALVKQLGWDRKTAPVGAEQWIAWTFLFTQLTAMRRGEALALTWEHVHLKRLVVHVPISKNGFARDVPLAPAALALFKLLTPGAPDAVVVPVLPGSFDTLFRRARDAAGIVGMTFHDTRRVGATALAAKLDVMELAASTGHRSINLLRQTYFQPNATAIAKKLA